MSYKNLPLTSLLVNRANDRHGELENETAAIAWLFHNREAHMRSLAKDIVERGEIYEPPLVSPEGNDFIIFDGNRRVTCLKVLADPRRAPTTELQTYFAGLRAKWAGTFPDKIQCQVENDRDRIDEILFRRHTGSQNGVGQSTWDDRMKSNFVGRTGKGGGLHVADEIEKRLVAAGLWGGTKKIPRSNMNRLLSSETYRNRLGFSVAKGKFEFTHDEAVSLAALKRVADDMVQKKIVLGDIWDVDGKRHYLDGLDQAGVLPTAAHVIQKPKPAPPARPGIPSPPSPPPTPKPTPAPKPTVRMTLIPQIDYGIAWPGRLQRLKSIWEELQFPLTFDKHANAISVLLRVLLELSIENYIEQTKLATINPNEKLALKATKVGDDLKAKGKITDKYHGEIKKLTQNDVLLSISTFNSYVHSPNFTPSPDHLRAMWDVLAEYITLCLKA